MKSAVLIGIGAIWLVCGLYQHSKLNELNRLAARSADYRYDMAIQSGDSRTSSFRAPERTDKTPVYLLYGLGGVFVALGIAVLPNISGSALLQKVGSLVSGSTQLPMPQFQLKSGTGDTNSKPAKGSPLEYLGVFLLVACVGGLVFLVLVSLP